jgi:hypothetical protein
MKNHQKQTTKNNNPQKQVHINKINTVNKNVPTQKAVPKIKNSVINLIRKTCVKLMCNEIFKINDVTTKTSRPFIKIETIKGVKWIGCLTLVQASQISPKVHSEKSTKNAGPKKLVQLDQKHKG